MKFTVVFVLAALVACVYAQQCPITGLPTPIVTSGLHVCPQYNGLLSCCNSTSEAKFASLQQLLVALGSGNCPKNLLNLLCDAFCSPLQATYIAGASASFLNISVNTNTSNYAYDSCAGVCSANSPTQTIAQTLGNIPATSPVRGAAFLGLVDKFLALVGTTPIFVLQEGGSVNALNTTMAPATAADAATCTSASSTSTTTSISGNHTSSTSTSGATVAGSSTSSTTTAHSSSSSASAVVASVSVLLVAIALM